jgi:diacylglycerol kinase (ATP)
MKKLKGIRRIINATSCSANGLACCFRTEEAFRLEVFAAIVLIPVGLLIGEGAVEKCLLAGSVLLLILVELLNTAVERVVDRISEEHHTLSGEAKDLGSAAVLVAMIITAMIWGLILTL